MAIVPVSRTVIAPLQLDLIGGGKAAGATPAPGGSSGNFADAVAGAIDHLNTMQNTADVTAQQAVSGQLNSIEDYLTAATEAQLGTQLTVAVRNKAVEAFQEIMRMTV